VWWCKPILVFSFGQAEQKAMFAGFHSSET